MTEEDNDITGHLDSLTNGVVRGWCAFSNRRDLAHVELYIDNNFITTITGSEFRSDLSDAKIYEGYAAFNYQMASSYHDGECHEVSLRIPNSDRNLPGSPLSFSYSSMGKGAWKQVYRSYLVHCNQTDDRIAELKVALKGVKRLAILCGYTTSIVPRRGTRNIVQQLKEAGFFVVHIHATDNIQNLEHWSDPSNSDIFFLKHNIGYDFGSWISGLALTEPWSMDIDEVLIINDSGIGPLFSLEPFLQPAHLERYGMYGLADSFEHSHHLQSYAVRLNREFLKSSVLEEFVQQYSITSDKAQIVQSGELGLSRLALQHGFDIGCEMSFLSVRNRWLDSYDSYLADALDAFSGTRRSSRAAEDVFERFECIREQALGGVTLNPTHYFWRSCFEDFRFPFLKRDLFLKNPVKIPDWALIPKVLYGLSEPSRNLLLEETKEGQDLVPFCLVSSMSE